MGLTFAFEVFIQIYRNVVLSLNDEPFIFITKLIIEIIYNAILTIIFYPLMQRFGYRMEETFKNPQILTRYF